MAKLTPTQKIKIALDNKQMTQLQLCDKIGYTSGNLSKMLSRGTFKTTELEKIVNGIGYKLEITLIDEITGERI
jgi:transcriptional regulator with XRE-family HTH domain